MAEIKTAPVRAQHVPDKEEFRDANGTGRIPGSFRISEPDHDGEQLFWYCCPCGCGRIAPLSVGNSFKPVDSPSWRWNGSFEAADLQPSVNHIGHWHGWLRDGVWVSC